MSSDCDTILRGVDFVASLRDPIGAGEMKFALSGGQQDDRMELAASGMLSWRRDFPSDRSTPQADKRSETRWAKKRPRLICRAAHLRPHHPK